MVLHQRRVGQLDANRVVNHHEDEEKGIRHEVLLPVVSQKFVMLTSLLVDLDGRHVNGLIAYEGTAIEHGNPDPEAEGLHK